MGTVRDIRSTPQDVMLDIDAELRHWRGCYRDSSFHRGMREFDDYIPTLKFGYDIYLRDHRSNLDDLLAQLKPRYDRCIPEWQRLEWPVSEAIIRETWKRMKNAAAWRQTASMHSEAGRATASL